ncbi:hypothetical protein M2360_004948 [Rhizobium sp. SG_E_25_P2]|uniref:hypothetical protein n=1 Tax=Rhizobium sp. SG_E_25_P2 TaxID=2879942 RepID=UPI0024749D54|nr:hypothetical protein [Rhizobium sp. SG_E_25_P2]MDH6269520.1 hypothetical protein [Rhizobium sp. SG_E_25_P2]
MPVFGRSLFETVLDGMDQEEEPVEEIGAAYAAPRGLRVSFVGFAEETNETEAAPASRFDWAGLFDDYAPPPKLEEPPVWLDRLSDVEISEDLALDQCRGASEIRERRRDFALANHPDRVGADYRNAATRRMMVANQLIDAALARLA